VLPYVGGASLHPHPLNTLALPRSEGIVQPRPSMGGRQEGGVPGRRREPRLARLGSYSPQWL
jgi:hypothetical protein